MSPTIFLLIALLKTPGEGGTVMIQYPTLAACEDAGWALETQFEAIQLDARADGTPVTAKPKALHICLEAPAQP